MKVNIAPFQYHVLECENIYLAGQRNVAILYEIPADVTDLQVKTAVYGIFRLYPALRIVFEKFAGEWKASLLEQNDITQCSELECTKDETIMEVASRVFHDFNCHLNIANDPLCRFVLIRNKAERKLLFLGNHMVYDMVSLKNIEINMWKLLYNKTSTLPRCRFLDWTAEITDYFNDDFHKDIPYWINTDWDKSVRLPKLTSQDSKPASREMWQYQFSRESSKSLLCSVGSSIHLIDLLLVRLHMAVSEFTSSSAMVVELWDNGRDQLKDRSSVGPYACFWPLFMDPPSGQILSAAKDISHKRATAPSKHGYLLGNCKGGGAVGIRELFQNIPEPQFKIDFMGHFTGVQSNVKQLSRITKIPKLIPVDHSVYSHISLIFSVIDGIITMNWSHSSSAYRKKDLQQIAKIMAK